jgi:uncharacterized small protein (DUF1192 family)
MDDEDNLPRPVEWQPRNLEPLSIDQLEAYVAVLEGEIARVRANIAEKESVRSAAEAFFRK